MCVATDLETFVATDGRDEKVAEVRRRIDAEGITYIYYQFVSVTGRIMGKGVPGAALGVDRPQGLPARLRRDGEPVRRPPRRVHRLRPGGRRARRHPGARDLHAAALGPEDRARLLHPASAAARRREDPALVPDRRLPRQPQAHPGGVRGADRPAPARRPRARDDVAQAERGRHAVGRGHDQALLLPHRPVLRAPAAHPQGHRVRPEDGPGHDPGRPRGRPGPARAELQLRPRRDHRRQPHDLPPDLQAGRPRDAAPSRASCPSRSWASRPTAATTTSRCGRATRTLFLPETRRPADAEQDRPRRHRRRARAPRRADRHHRLDGQLLPPPLGHRLLGAGLRRLGLPEPHHRAARVGARAASSTARSTPPSTRTCRWPR